MIKPLLIKTHTFQNKMLEGNIVTIIVVNLEYVYNAMSRYSRTFRGNIINATVTVNLRK